MKVRMVVVYTILGALFGELILHPLFIIVGHIMLESNIGHDHTLSELIVSDLWDSFSLETLPWSMAFAIIGALLVNHIGYMMNMYYKVRDLSNLDGLTGIANRRYFQEEFDRIWKQSMRVSKPISLIMCDIDDFKIYNDTYGHQKGDTCLQLVARTLNETLKRPLDMVARYGGEEFVIMLPDTTLKGASLIAEDIRAKVESLKIIHDKSKVAKVVTLSFGVATITPNHNSNYDILISEADKALYKAKKEGKNRVEVAS